MKLKELYIKNFKGVPSFKMSTNGANIIEIFGQNESGKTTLFDAVTWLLFGKDSLNSANFDIKTLNENGEAVHGLEHTVEGVFTLNGNDMALKKTYQEKWVKRRGSATREFTGHTVDHFIDGVPVKQKEYNQQINDICEEDLFRLLANPRYFNEVLHWQDRRTLLLRVCGDISDEDVIKSDPELSTLPDILKNRKLEDHRKVIAGRRTEINKELDKIPVRIDEIKSSAVNSRDKDTIAKDLATDTEGKKTAEGALKEIKAGGESSVLTTKLRDIENRINEIDNAAASAQIKAMNDRAKERRDLKDKVDTIGGDISIASRERESLTSGKQKVEENIERVKDEIVGLRERWHEEDVRVLKFEQSSTCPSCGQSLPEEELEAAREKALSVFNEAKAKTLTSITEGGKLKTAAIESYNKSAEEMAGKLQAVESAIKTLLDKKDKAEEALKQFDEHCNAKEPDNPEQIVLFKEKDRLEDTIRIKKDSVDSAAIAEGEAQIEAIDIRIMAYQKELMQIEANARIDVRIKELSDQERKLSAEFEGLEHQLYLTEQFIRTKVRLLEERINSRFKVARFKLFDEQINEGLKETCVVTVNGVPYPSMNNASRINVGLDICNALSDHFKKSLPVFIDNAEAVSKLLPTSAQQIRLTVSAKDKTLRIQGGK